MSNLCIILCFGLIQSNVMAAEVKSGQVLQGGNLVDVQDGTQLRKDIIISDQDKKDVLLGNLNSSDLLKKYGAKTQGGGSVTSLATSSITSLATSSVTGYNNLKNSFYFLSDSTLYGGDQSLLGAPIGPSTGCGPIAGANILAYHAKYYGRASLYPYNWVLSDWKKFQNDMFATGGGPQILPDFIRMIKSYTSAHGYTYGLSSQSYVLNNDTNLTSLANFIKSSIDGNNPPAMLLGTNMPGTSYQPDFANHWVTITEYNFNNGKTDVTVSSWGGKYPLSLASLLADRAWIDIASAYR